MSSMSSICPHDPRSFLPASFMPTLAGIGLHETNFMRYIGAVLGERKLSPEQWAADGIISRKEAAKLAPLPELSLVEAVTSPIDGFQKLLFRTQDDLNVETVIIPLLKSDAVTICVSSQVGCVMGCTFCATARMSRRRNLLAWEIVDQYQQARKIAQSRGQRVTGAVFMGMGEPFLNYENVICAATLFSFPVKNAIRSKAITISTVGLVEEILRFTAQKLPFRLSVSLGAATDEKRRRLVPVAARTPVKEVMQAARQYSLSRNDRVNMSYVCISGENMSEDDARALAELIADTRVRLDLIEVTDSSGRFNRPGEEEFKAFRNYLSRYLKQPVVRRYSGGADINAACGTLAGTGQELLNIHSASV